MAPPPPVRPGEEPPLAEVMDDPIVRALMAIDGVTVSALHTLVEEAKARLQGSN